ncbi:class II fructose-bisphosphate aldolase [Vibrio breoganii]
MSKAAFNVFDFDGIKAVSDAAGELNQQVYLQFSSSTVAYYGADSIAKMIDVAAGKNRAFLIVHLDHCTDFSIIRSCVDNGWDSIMGDFSHLPLKQNIKKMLEIKEIVGNRRVLIEGELGQVAGVEDGHGEEGGSYVDLSDVRTFVESTGIDLLAVGIGNAHGFYSSTDSIDIDLLRKVHESVPEQKLVLHGGTGIEKHKISAMKDLGIDKINISTELKECYIQASSKHASSSDRYNMIKLVNTRYEDVRKLAVEKILEFK